MMKSSYQKPFYQSTAKPKKQRRKEKERTEEERAKENEKLNNVRLNDVYRLKTLKREIKSDDLEKGLKLIAKEKIKKSKMNEPKRLGKQKFVKPKVVYQLSEEISGSLRGLKPEGDLFLDRLKSLEKRNIIEPRRRVLPRRKYKLKEVEKRSYKKPTVKDLVAIKRFTVVHLLRKKSGTIVMKSS